MTKGQGYWERKRKNCNFSAYLRQNWIDLCQTKTKMIHDCCTHIFEYISTAKRINFRYLSVFWQSFFAYSSKTERTFPSSLAYR